MTSLITTAVIPVAGFGTRFLPATKAIPKEMLPLVDKPILQYAVEEAYAAGIEHIIFVTSRNKKCIEDHFDSHPELERQLIASNQLDILDKVRATSPSNLKFSYVRQDLDNRGLGYAVLCARHLISHGHFAVMLPDDVFIHEDPTKSPLGDLISRSFATRYHMSDTWSSVAVSKVPDSEVHRYGIMKAGADSTHGLLAAKELLEKPTLAAAGSSRNALFGRYLLSRSIFDRLSQLHQSTPPGQQVQLTDAMNLSIRSGFTVLGVPDIGTRHDCGTISEYLKTQLSLSLSSPVFGKDLTHRLVSLTKENSL